MIEQFGPLVLTILVIGFAFLVWYLLISMCEAVINMPKELKRIANALEKLIKEEKS